jgi:hypothetical protein
MKASINRLNQVEERVQRLKDKVNEWEHSDNNEQKNKKVWMEHRRGLGHN